MKFEIVLAFFVAVLVATITAQPGCPTCPQGTCQPTCVGAPDVGTNCTTASSRGLWYFDPNSRTCRPLAHLGCGGNNNRWCSKLACIIRCVLFLG